MTPATRRPGAGSLGSGPLDADLSDRIAAGELGPVPADPAAFRAAFARLVEAAGPDGWDRLYDGTLRRVLTGWVDPPAGTGTVATCTRVWARAIRLSRGGRVLDVGTGLGFLPLAWAARRRAPRLTALDADPASVAVAGRQAARSGRRIGLCCAHPTRLPLDDQAQGTVLLLGVLDGLPADAAAAALAEAQRVAAARVVVAVPTGTRPGPAAGPREPYDLRRLAALGAGTGWHVSLEESDGSWLVLDRPSRLQ